MRSRVLIDVQPRPARSMVPILCGANLRQKRVLEVCSSVRHLLQKVVFHPQEFVACLSSMLRRVWRSPLQNPAGDLLLGRVAADLRRRVRVFGADFLGLRSAARFAVQAGHDVIQRFRRRSASWFRVAAFVYSKLTKYACAAGFVARLAHFAYASVANQCRCHATFEKPHQT